MILLEAKSKRLWSDLGSRHTIAFPWKNSQRASAPSCCSSRTRVFRRLHRHRGTCGYLIRYSVATPLRHRPPRKSVYNKEGLHFPLLTIGMVPCLHNTTNANIQMTQTLFGSENYGRWSCRLCSWNRIGMSTWLLLLQYNHGR